MHDFSSLFPTLHHSSFLPPSRRPPGSLFGAAFNPSAPCFGRLRQIILTSDFLYCCLCAYLSGMHGTDVPNKRRGVAHRWSKLRSARYLVTSEGLPPLLCQCTHMLSLLSHLVSQSRILGRRTCRLSRLQRGDRVSVWKAGSQNIHNIHLMKAVQIKGGMFRLKSAISRMQ